jgi:TolB-like protein/tetratricopeptide (TPR) repeat protein/predicted Ser/Thr protein kinase
MAITTQFRGINLASASSTIASRDECGAYGPEKGCGMKDTDDRVLPLGTILGSYRVERVLGRGGMGTVYLAYDAELRRQLALKVVTGSGATDLYGAMILREARSAAALNHPNICTIYEVGEADGLAFIAMEYVEGSPISEVLETGALPPSEAIRYGQQAADALAYAHEHGVIHRDLKAANAIVSKDGRLKLVDFGLAQRRYSAAANVSTMTSPLPVDSSGGTPYVMAPEQVRGEAADARTDIWALGVLLYEMVGAGKPFQAATIPDVFSSILRDPPRPLPDRVPPALRQLIGRCLEKLPERRYPHASDVRVALELLDAHGAALRTGPKPLRPRGVLLIGATIVAVAVMLVGLNVGGLRDRLMGKAAETAAVTLAVLPLENLTGSPDQDDWCDGLTEDIARVLGREHASRLRIIARSASTPYRRSAKSADLIGRELGAECVLKGSVARSQDRVHIVAELVRTSSARSVWSQTYDRGIDDLLGVEHEIADAVFQAMQIQLAGVAKSVSAERHKPNPDAYDLYLRGLSHVFRTDELDIDQAIALLEKAAALDPAFVPTQAHLALAYGYKSSFFRPSDPQWEEKGFAAVQKAIQLDPDAAEAHYAQAMMVWRPSHGFPNREALAELRKAIAAQPDFDEALHQHAVVLYHVGHLDAALRELERAIAINPSNTIARFRFGPIYLFQQKFEDALAAINRVPPQALPSQWAYQKAWALISLGRLDEAGWVVDDALKDNPADQGGVLHAARAMLRAKRGDRRSAEADVAEAIRVGKGFIHFHHTAYTIGAVYTALGDLEKAEEWIERAANDGFPNYQFFETDANLEPLRASARFRTFLTRLRQEWEHIPGEPD